MCSLRVRLVGEVEKWKDKKWWENGKDFNFLPFCSVRNEKNEGMKKVSLYKFMHTPLLKNDAQLQLEKW